MALRILLLASLAVLLPLALLHTCQRSSFGSRWRRDVIFSAPLLSSSEPAPVCQTIACPPYKSVHQGADFEIREYREAVWAETEPLPQTSFQKAGVAGFHSLFQYIQGRNVEGVHIPMTAPVLTTIKPDAGPFRSPAFTVKFFVPPQFAKSPPQPSTGLPVTIVDLPRRCVAVRQFPGFATDFNVVLEAKLLAKSLNDTPWANVTASHPTGEVYSIAQYNSPFEFLKRVNEVWAPFTGDGPNCTAAAHSVPALAALV